MRLHSSFTTTQFIKFLSTHGRFEVTRKDANQVLSKISTQIAFGDQENHMWDELDHALCKLYYGLQS